LDIIVPEKPKLLVAGLHSVSDWDFQYPAPNYILDTTLYVVAPASLRLKYTGSGYPAYNVLCKYSPCLNLPQGELRTWYRATHGTEGWCTFRNQANVGVADQQNCYATTIAPTSLSLYRNVGGGSTLVGTVDITHATGTWEHWRLVWWNGNDIYGADALCFRLYKEVGGSWVQQGDTLTDTNNQFKDTGKGRVGLRAQTSKSIYANFDETEIWGPA